MPLIKHFLLALIFLFSMQGLTYAHKKEIAITIDDLPFVGEYRNFHLKMIIDALVEHQVSATGFIIASEVRDNSWEMLNKFRDAGFGLGNHTLTHANLNTVKTQHYIHEIGAADHILLPVLTKPKYFRYPYLAMSSGVKKDTILCYLTKKHYQVAPITVDSKDFLFNQRLLSVPEANRRTFFNELKPFYLDFIWQQTLKAEEYNQIHHQEDQAQILLIHANLLNAYVLPDIIQMYKQKGYAFVNLPDALSSFKNITTSCNNPKLLIQPTIQPKPQKLAKAWVEPKATGPQDKPWIEPQVPKAQAKPWVEPKVNKPIAKVENKPVGKPDTQIKEFIEWD